MYNSKDDRKLHFVAVAEEQGVIGEMPSGIYADRVHADLLCCNHLSNFEFLRPDPS